MELISEGIELYQFKGNMHDSAEENTVITSENRGNILMCWVKCWGSERSAVSPAPDPPLDPQTDPSNGHRKRRHWKDDPTIY